MQDFILRPPWRAFQLPVHEKIQGPEKESKTENFFTFFVCVIFAFLDPDPDF